MLVCATHCAELTAPATSSKRHYYGRCLRYFAYLPQDPNVLASRSVRSERPKPPTAHASPSSAAQDSELLTLFPRRGFRRALSPRRVPSARPLRLAPWASGVAPGLIRTARARATIVQESAKCENTDVCISWRPFLALERSSEKAFKNAKHGSQLLRSSS